MRKALLLAAATFTLATVLACGSDSGSGGTADDGGLPESGGFDSGVVPKDGGKIVDSGSPTDSGADADAGPVAAPFGLDSRPSNKTCVAAARPVLDTGIALQKMWGNISSLTATVAMRQAPGDNDTWYVVDLYGKVSKLSTNAQTDADVTTWLLINVTVGGEGGLLGIAFHPDWPAKKEVYLSYTRPVVAGDPPAPPACPTGGTTAWTQVLSRFTSPDGVTLDPTPDEIIKLGHPYQIHHGGNILFSPIDKMLYFGTGDGGGNLDSCNSGQDLTSLFGKMLRIDVNAGPGKYNIPKDNPFVGVANVQPEIYAYGLRNPWRWSFDRATGALWLGDVGQSTWEEIDNILPGANYGWNICEGKHKLGDTVNLCATPGLTDPVLELPRTDANAVVGGYFYRGSAMPSLVGTYIFGDFALGNIWALTYDADNKPVPKLIANVDPVSMASFAEGNDGELYVLQYTGIISKIVPAGPPMPDTFPKLLSQTGCTDPKDATKIAPGVIPYDLNSPLWSDGAAKRRYLAIPDGKTITVTATGDFDLPIGSVAMKDFDVGGKRVETRLFMRHDDGGWAGYTYEWNDAQTDATLLLGGKVKPVNGGAQQWTFPSRPQCRQCHSAPTGGTIGLETSQLNRTMTYVATNRVSNELATLDHIGMFSAPLAAPSTLPALPVPSGAAAVDLRARSYLHANCSHCHQPGGAGQGTMDLRYPTAFKDTNTCNAQNTQGSINGVQTLLTPGSPAQSILSLRMHATDGKRMPALAVSIPDPLGTTLLDTWIKGVATCP